MDIEMLVYLADGILEGEYNTDYDEAFEIISIVYGEEVAEEWLKNN